MPFPFIAPFEPWMNDVLDGRTKNRHLTTLKNPYAILISTAKVAKATTGYATETDRLNGLKKVIEASKSTDSSKIFFGCIVANHGSTNITKILTDINYSSDKTAIGYDFTGQRIEVEGESGMQVPMSLVESIVIDTDGANNTLKSAKVSIRCFTLKQLEMFELFYMKPGMNVLLEFGDASLLNKDILLQSTSNNTGDTIENKKKKTKYFKDGTPEDLTPYDTVNEGLFYNLHKNFNTFCDEFATVFRMSKRGNIEYNKVVAKSLGSYDRVAGKVTDYGFSIDSDGTYNVNIEITQANQLSLAIPVNSRKKTSNEQTPSENDNLPDLEKIKYALSSTFGLEKSRLDTMMNNPNPSGKPWDDEFFNFIPPDPSKKIDKTSYTSYVSFRFILSILMKYNESVVDKTFSFELPKYEVNGVETEMIPVQTNALLISSSEDIIFPSSQLPIFTAGKDTSNVNSLIVVAKEHLDGRIKEYDFLISSNEVKTLKGGAPQTVLTLKEPGGQLADALNIFLKYETVARIWNQSIYKIDFLDKILELINMHSHGMFILSVIPQDENQSPTVLDILLAELPVTPPKITTDEKPYRFKANDINSILKNFTFNFEMSNIIAARTVFNSANFLRKLQDENFKDTDELSLSLKTIKQVDYSSMCNADGYFAINFSEYKALEKKIIELQEEAKRGNTSTESTETPPEEKTIENVDITALIDGNSVRFKLKKTDPVTLIYKDAAFVSNLVNIRHSEKKNKPTLTNIDVSFTIDGFSGFRCGQYFHISGVPEIYNQTGIFQITNIKHSLQNSTGWETTVEASFRVINLE